MNVITDNLRQIVRRKLWPVALVLLGALAAVPLVLAKEPETAPVAANTAKVESIPATFVTATQPTEETQRRRVLGGIKDPFEPAPLPKSKKKKKKAKASDTATPTAAPTQAPTADRGTPDVGSSGGATTPTPPVSPGPPSTPTTTVPAYSIKVRFGTTEAGDPQEKTVERLSVLPDEENPVLVYRGVENGGKIAIFELTGKVDAQGDGECMPTPEDCRYLKLHAGETEFITVTDTGDETDAQYQLDLVKIYKKATKEKATDPTTQSLAKASSASLKSKGVKLRRRNRYVFDSTTGTLRLARGKKSPL
jgi:hypothetical protein